MYQNTRVWLGRALQQCLADSLQDLASNKRTKMEVKLVYAFIKKKKKVIEHGFYNKNVLN